MQMADKKSLVDEIKKFQSQKKIYVIALFGLGALGLIFPVIPGLLLIGLGIALISPKYGETFLKKIKQWFHSVVAIFRF